MEVFILQITKYAFFLTLLLTVASLAFGLFIYFKGDGPHKKYANAAMRWRVMFQAFTLILFFILLSLKR
ncbi:MAG: twin transmembrane helix small protein [Alphaproteobacteria bacterium]|nr:twin transmembrane helix small protein [Alphaproteobacteria bacterium]